MQKCCVIEKILTLRRIQKVGISVSFLLACISGTTCWLLSHVWAWKQVVIQEPRFPIIVTEVVTLGLVAVFGLLCIIYFWRKA